MHLPGLLGPSGRRRRRDPAGLRPRRRRPGRDPADRRHRRLPGPAQGWPGWSSSTCPRPSPRWIRARSSRGLASSRSGRRGGRRPAVEFAVRLCGLPRRVRLCGIHPLHRADPARPGGYVAARRGVPYAGRDGKTGETLVKSALAPMFAAAHCGSAPGSGLNLLGGGDGALADPADKVQDRLQGPGLARSSVQPRRTCRSVHRVARRLEDGLGPRSLPRLPRRADELQFTWQGCDSALAAPLVLDLARLVARAHEKAARLLPELGYFFEPPGSRARPDRAVRPAAARRGAVMRALLELVRAPAALSVPGDTMAGPPPPDGVRHPAGASVLMYWAGMALTTGRPGGRRRAARAPYPASGSRPARARAGGRQGGGRDRALAGRCA